MWAEEQPTLQPLPVSPFRYYQYGVRTVHLDGCVEVEAAYYSAPPGWIGQRVHVQWTDGIVRLLTRDGQLLREHVRSPRGHRRIAEADRPAQTPASTLALLGRARRIGAAMHTLCTHIHTHEGAAGTRRILGALALTKRYGTWPVLDVDDMAGSDPSTEGARVQGSVGTGRRVNAWASRLCTETWSLPGFALCWQDACGKSSPFTSSGGHMTTRQALLVASAIAAAFAGWRGTTAQQRSVSGEWQRAPATTWSASPAGIDQPRTGQPGRRVVSAAIDVPILEHLRPADLEVEVVRTQHFLVEGFDDAHEELEFLTRHAAAVVTVQGLAVTSQVNEDQTWIQSVLTARVTDVLKNASSVPLSDGVTLSLPFEGGEVVVNGKRVRATSTPIIYPAADRQYLYFLLESDGRLAPMPPVHTFELTGNTVKRLYDGNGRWGLDKNISQDLVLNSVRSMAGLPTVRPPEKPR